MWAGSGDRNELLGEAGCDGLAIFHSATVLEQDLLSLLDVLRRNPGQRLALAAFRREVSEGQLEDAEGHRAVEGGRPLEQRVDGAVRILLGGVEGFLGRRHES